MRSLSTCSFIASSSFSSWKEEEKEQVGYWRPVWKESADLLRHLQSSYLPVPSAPDEQRQKSHVPAS